MKRVIVALTVFIILFTQSVFAEVVTTEKTEGYAKYMYIAGAPDNYPIEYYDEATEKYCGIIPDL